MSPILSLRGIRKRFGAVEALADVDLDVFPGEVHAVLGENGAGKSTLMKVMFGLVIPDSGTLHLHGAGVRFRSALDARRAGIGMVHQEFALIDALSVAENLTLSVCPSIGWWWRRADVVEAARQLAGGIGLPLGDLDAPVGTLAVGMRQRIEIVKALAGNTRILILDEPTAVLTPQEVSQLFTVLARLRAAGTAVVFITHKLAEVMAIADRISVMRRGRVVARAERGTVSETDLARLMIGPLADIAPATTAPADNAPTRLELSGLSVASDRGLPSLHEVSLSVRGGEIFGIAGVDGNGQAELFEVLAGVRAPTAGAVHVDGARIRRFDPAALQHAGVACVPPDRQRQGVVAAMSVRDNAVLSALLLRRLSPGLLTRPAAERYAAQAMVDAYAIKVDDLEAPVRSLSGGNVQKLVVARALSLAPRVLIAASPTRGLDLAAARAVYAAFDAALARGAAVLLISTDLDEILARAHRLAVLSRGQLSAVLERPVSTARLSALMAGHREAS
jgi:general nucleoside transport system ATP-binding protein